MNKLIIPIIVILIIAAGIGGYFIFQRPTSVPPIHQEITTFEECAKAGGKILMTYPHRCMLPDGRTFTEEEKETTQEIIMPKGSYATTVTDKVLKNPEVVGILINAKWQDIEKTEGNFDWSVLDEDINATTMYGKVVTLNIVANGRNTPDWVKGLPGVQLIAVVDTNEYHDTFYCQEITMPVFWDSIFLEKKKTYINEAGKRYASNKNIVGIMVSFANAYTNDWNVPHSTGRECNKDLDQVQDWLDAGYTTDKMFNAGKETISTYAMVFPNQALKLPIGVTHEELDGTRTKLAEMIIGYAYDEYPDRFFTQVNFLSSSFPYSNSSEVVNAMPGDRNYLYKLMSEHSPNIGFQMLAGASNGKSNKCRLNKGVSPCPPYDVLLEAVKIGLSYKPSYIEYWHIDAENPELESVLQYANDVVMVYE